MARHGVVPRKPTGNQHRPAWPEETLVHQYAQAEEHGNARESAPLQLTGAL